MDDRRPYIFATRDYGKSWKRIVNGIPDDDFVHVVREDTRRPGLLFAGTEHGVYVSFNDGSDWQSLSLNLPDTQTADLVVEDNDIVIATHGRSFYILDGIGLMRQLTPEIAGRKSHLFEPRPVIRRMNPAVIDYYLNHGADKVVIDILDAKGQLIRSFDSSASAGNTPRAEGDEEGTSSAAPKPPATNDGANRFVWDVRYPGPAVFPGIVLRGAVPGLGPVAPPGAYTVRLRANGETQTRQLLIQRDPRLTDISDADLEQQFQLAMQIRDETSQAHDAIIRIRAINDQLNKRSPQLRDQGLANRAAELKTKLSGVEEDLYQVRNRSPRDTLNYPIKLNNQLAALQQWVDTGDARPTDQDYAVFQELSTKLVTILATLDHILTTELKQLNDQLAARNLELVK